MPAAVAIHLAPAPADERPRTERSRQPQLVAALQRRLELPTAPPEDANGLPWAAPARPGVSTASPVVCVCLLSQARAVHPPRALCVPRLPGEVPGRPECRQPPAATAGNC